MPKLLKMVHGDNLSKMKSMDDNCVDLVFYDPPYNVKKKYDGYDDNLSEERYMQWMKEVWEESNRISKNGIAVYIGSELISRFYRNVVPGTAHQIIVHKRAAGVFAGGYMLQYHAILNTAPPVVKCKDLWEIRVPGEGYFFKEQRFDHPGMTGLALTQKVIAHFTRPGDVVLDPFCGTGTTLIACKNTNRNGIGIEQSRKYIEIYKKRLVSSTTPMESIY